MVLSYERDHSGTRRGDVSLVWIFLEQTPVLVGDKVGSQSDFVHGVESEGSDHSHEFTGRDIGEFRGEAGRHYGGHMGA